MEEEVFIKPSVQRQRLSKVQTDVIFLYGSAVNEILGFEAVIHFQRLHDISNPEITPHSPCISLVAIFHLKQKNEFCTSQP